MVLFDIVTFNQTTGVLAFSAFFFNRTHDIRDPQCSGPCRYDVSCCPDFDVVVYVGCVRCCRVSLTLQRQIMHLVKEVAQSFINPSITQI